MPTDLPLILRALRRHWPIVILLALQVAIACAVAGNGINLVRHRFALQALPSGIDDARLLVLDVQALQGKVDDADRQRAMQAALALPGVDAAGYVNALPFDGRPGNFRVSSVDGVLPRSEDAAVYNGSPGFMEMLGARILAGRGFAPADFAAPSVRPLQQADTVVLAERLATRLGAVPGQQVRISGRAFTVVGIAADVLPPSISEPGQAGLVAFIPAPPGGPLASHLVLRADNDASPNLLEEAIASVTRSTPHGLAWSGTRLAQLRADYFAFDQAVVRLLASVGVILALVVAGGVGGLSSYWIEKRRKTIAIRRALGARRRDIAWYFRLENMLVTGLGAAIGLGCAIGLSVVLTGWLGTPSMPLAPALAGALGMMALGQVAILAPIRRAIGVVAVGVGGG